MVALKASTKTASTDNYAKNLQHMRLNAVGDWLLGFFWPSSNRPDEATEQYTLASSPTSDEAETAHETLDTPRLSNDRQALIRSNPRPLHRYGDFVTQLSTCVMVHVGSLSKIVEEDNS